MHIPRNPVTGKPEIRFIPQAVENFIGRIMYPVLCNESGGTVSKTDRVYGRYVGLVEAVGASLAKHSPRKGVPFEFKVLNSKKHNAWCLPGGKIGINVGLIEALERESSLYNIDGEFSLQEKVAAVLSHEITHATACHTARQVQFTMFLVGVIKVAEFVLQLFFGLVIGESIRIAADRLIGLIAQGLLRDRSQCYEFEADKYGMHLMDDVSQKDRHWARDSALAHVWLQSFFVDHHNGRSGIALIDKWREFWSTHPAPQSRLQANIRTWEALQRQQAV